MRISIDTQQELYDRHAVRAVDMLIARLATAREELVKLGRTRAFRDVGVHEYGDSTYWISPSELEVETDAELADAIFYEQIKLARTAGDLPNPSV